METFKKMVPQQATVIRDGEFSSAKCEDIVVGDVVQINAGRNCVMGYGLWGRKKTRLEQMIWFEG